MTLTLAVAAGLLIGLTLGALGGGGSILAVPVLVYGLGESALAATTGALVVVGLSAVAGAVAARREGTVLLARGLWFGAVATGGAAAGAWLATYVDDDVLLVGFAALMLVVGGLLVRRVWRARHGTSSTAPTREEPIIRFSPSFACQCPRALRVVATATAVGLLTGFFGVGGGFLVVPALMLALGMSVRHATGTSLVVIAVTSAVALAVRLGSGAGPDWPPVLLLTAAAAIGGVVGARAATAVDPRRLATAFTALVLAVGVGTAVQATPAVL